MTSTVVEARTGDTGRRFGELLLRHRLAAGLSQRQVAARSGLSERAVRDLERGVTGRPRPHSVRSLAAAIGLTGDDLTGFLTAGQPGGDGPSGGAVAARLAGLARADLVGRRDELRALVDLVTGERHRLVTVTGPGGVGKSRLAAELVATLRRGAGMDVRTVDLSGLGDHRLVGEVLAETLGYGGTSWLPAVDRIATHLRQARLILVVDGFERLLPAAPDLAALVRRCPRMTVVVTSQRPLDVRGERLVPIPALAVRDAVELFARRARAASEDFTLTPATLGTVRHVCEILDGLPLALELAAARLRMLSVAELAQRLDRPLHLLTDGARDLPERHRSLRATIMSTVSSLDEPARILFARLAPFATGPRLAELEAVAARLGGGDDLLSALGQLVDASLVRVGRTGTTSRYRLADTVREVAAEVLAGRVERPAVEAAVAAVYLDRLRAAGAAGEDAVGDDADNVRAAVEWARVHYPSELDNDTVEALYRYCERRGRIVEGRTTLLALADARVPGAPWALLGAGNLSRILTDIDGAERLAARAQRVMAPADHAGRLAAALLLGSLAAERGDLVRATAHAHDALALARAAGDERAAGRAWNNLGAYAMIAGDGEQAERYHRQALAARRRGGAGENDIGMTLMNLADLALARARWPVAAEHAAEAAAAFARGGHDLYHAFSLSILAISTLHAADRSGAGPAAEESLRLLASVPEERALGGLVRARASVVRHALGQLDGMVDGLAQGLDDMAGGLARYDTAPVIEAHAALLAERHPAAAARLLGLAGAVRDSQEHAQPHLLMPAERIRTACRRRLGARRLDDEVAAGAALVGDGVAVAAATLLGTALA